ncbi:MAG: efflux RND transporter permease subunit [bacterium]|nr:efflux RND transporter permease subunit [bacterium]
MIRFFAKHSTAATLLMLILLAMGAFSLSSLRRQTFPEFSADQVEVRVMYPGATAEEVEEAICQRIEDVLDGINYVEEVRAEAQEGLARAIVEMQEGGDLPIFIGDIKREVEAVNDFPQQAEEPVIVELGTSDPVVSIGVTGDMSPRDLKAYGEELKTRLQREDAISLVTIHGFSDHQIRIQFPAQTLMQFNLSLADIANIIARQSVDMPAGSLKTSDQDILLRFTDQRRTPQEFEDVVVVTSKSGAEIRLGDIATITDVFERDEDKLYFNGKRAVLLQISKTGSEDTLTVFDAVKGFLEREELRKPPSVVFSLANDMSSVVRDRLLLLLKNGWQGFILVFLTLWLFFNLRLSFWVAMGLPVSFLGACFFLPPLNYTINMITMVGLLIALGLLMDDAIVIAENVATHLNQGKKALNAVIDGTMEVKNGVISSFLTTVCVFGPLAFITGSMGKVLRVMPVVLILVLAVSLVEGFLILPNHLAHSFAHYDPAKVGRFRKKFDAAIEWTRNVPIGKIADLAVKWRYLFAGLTVAAFILSIGMLASGRLKFEAFPDADGNVVEARVLLPQGTPLEQTESVVKRITEAIETIDQEWTPSQPEGEQLVTNMIVQYNKNVSASEQGAHVATISVDLLGSEIRTATIDQILGRWRELVGSIPDAIALNYTEPQLSVAGIPLEIRLIGDDLDLLKRASIEMQDWFNTLVGVFDVSDDLRPGKPEVRIKMRDDVSIPGLSAQVIATQLRSAYYGAAIAEIQVGPESYEIDARLIDADQNSLADLEYFYVTLPDGTQAPLGSVASLQVGRGYGRIARIDGQRTVTITGELDSQKANAAQIVTLLQQEFLPDFETRYPDVRVAIEGQAGETQKTGASMQRGFLIGLFGIFVLLSFQFRSYIEPIIVMLAIPFALIGVIWGHIFMGLNISMPSMMGFASLAGVVVNDSILLVEFIKMRRKDGMSIPAAASQAGRERFRAVLLTSLTTIAGLLPLLAEKSLQAKFLIPLAVSISFGLMASTVLVLIILPSFYTILGDFGIAAKIETEEG